MSWIVLSLLIPILLAGTNIVDDYMSRHQFRDKSFLYVFAGGVFLLIPAIAIYALHPEARAVPFGDALKMAAMGAVLMTSFISLYIFSMQRSGATIVIPVMQTIPAFVFLGGYLFLGETVSGLKLGACAAIMLAAIAITWNFKARGFNAVSLGLIITASIIIAAYILFTRYFTGAYDPYTILAHVWGGFGGVCLVMLLAVRKWLPDLRRMVVETPKVLMGCLAAQAVFQTLGELTQVHALKIAPAAGLVQTINGMQPAYILVFFMIAGHLAPKAYQKMPFDRVLAWKFGCIIILFAGIAAISLDQ